MSEVISSPDRSLAQALAALNMAALAISRDLELDQTLQHIVDSARDLVSADYAALAVFSPERLVETFVFSGLALASAERIENLPGGRGLLGAVLDEKHAIRVPDIERDPRSFGFPAGHPPMTSFLGVPIATGDEVFGNLYLTDKRGSDQFGEADEELITIFAAHAAVAIKNARLYEEVGRLAIMEERSRIGMDLHDGVIQSIYAVGLTLETIRLLVDQQPEKARDLIDQAIAGLNEAIRDIRNFILDLRPRRFDGDLDEGIARLVREFQANAMIEVAVNVPHELPESLPSPISRAVFLTAQEALANIARHARASSVTLELSHADDDIRLKVSDDGKGFDVKQQDQMVGHGLANMRARAEELGGTFSVESQPQQGTSVALKLPLRP